MMSLVLSFMKEYIGLTYATEDLHCMQEISTFNIFYAIKYRDQSNYIENRKIHILETATLFSAH